MGRLARRTSACSRLAGACPEAAGRGRPQVPWPRARQRDCFAPGIGTQGYDREHVDPDDAGRKSTVDEGTVYDHVYVVEVVPDDGDVSEDWDDEQREQRYIKNGLKDKGLDYTVIIIQPKRFECCAQHELREVNYYK